MKKIFSFGGKKEGQDAAAKQPKKVVDAKNADISVEQYKKNIEEVLKKIDQNFENIRQDEGYQGLVTQYQTAYFTWTRQTTPSSEMGLISAAHEIILFYVQNIINPALEQVGALMKIQPKANKQEEVDLSTNLLTMLMYIDRDILTYNKQLGELHKSRGDINKYIKKYDEIKKEHFQLRKKDITEEHNFEKDILKNLKLIIRAQAKKQGIYLQSKTPAAGGDAKTAAGGDAQAVAARTSERARSRTPSPNPAALNAGWEAEVALSDSKVNVLVAELEAEKALIDKELQALQAKNEELAGKLTKPMHSNQDSLEREAEEELAAMEAAKTAAGGDAKTAAGGAARKSPSPSQDSRAVLAAQQQAAAKTSPSSSAARSTSPRSNSPDSLGSTSPKHDMRPVGVISKSIMLPGGTDLVRAQTVYGYGDDQGQVPVVPGGAKTVSADLRSAKRTEQRSTLPRLKVRQLSQVPGEGSAAARGSDSTATPNPSAATMPIRPSTPAAQGPASPHALTRSLAVSTRPNPKTIRVPGSLQQGRPDEVIIGDAIEAGAAGSSANSLFAGQAGAPAALGVAWLPAAESRAGGADASQEAEEEIRAAAWLPAAESPAGGARSSSPGGGALPQPGAAGRNSASSVQEEEETVTRSSSQAAGSSANSLFAGQAGAPAALGVAWLPAEGAAVRNSARASSPGSESSRTESAADSLLAEQADEIEARAAGRSPARASSPGGALPQPGAGGGVVPLSNPPGGSRNAIEARATTPPQRTSSPGGALPQPGAGGGGGPLSNPPGAGGDSPAMRRQTRYEVIESINEKQIYFLINIAKGLQEKNKEEVTTLLTEIAKEKPELYNKVKKDDKELGPAYSKHFIDEFYKDENSQSTQFIEDLIADNNELRVIKTIFSTIKTRQQPIVHRDGPDQGAKEDEVKTGCIGRVFSRKTEATRKPEDDDISIASSASYEAEHGNGRG